MGVCGVWGGQVRVVYGGMSVRDGRLNKQYTVCLLWSPSTIQPGLIRDPESASAQPRVTIINILYIRQVPYY